MTVLFEHTDGLGDTLHVRLMAPGMVKVDIGGEPNSVYLSGERLQKFKDAVAAIKVGASDGT